MKMLSGLFGLAALLLVTQTSLAEWLIEDVSPERAKELGVAVRARPNGNAGIKVTLEFKPEGVLKDFNRVELRMTAEEKSLVSAPLHVALPTPDRATANFSAEPSLLAGSSLTIFVPGGLGGEAYRFKVKDFVEVEKLR